MIQYKELTYIGAKLAAGEISFAEVGPMKIKRIYKRSYIQAGYKDGTITGAIIFLDYFFMDEHQIKEQAKIRTNINEDLLKKHNFNIYEGKYNITIKRDDKVVYSKVIADDAIADDDYGYLYDGVNLYFSINNELSVSGPIGNFNWSNNASYGSGLTLSISKIE